MTWRQIATYYALSLVLGGYYFMFEWRPNPDMPLRGARRVQQSRFLPIARDDVKELVFRFSQGTVHFRKNEQRWEVSEPAGIQVSPALLTSVVEVLTSEKEVQIIDPSASDFVPYGLATPHATIDVIGANQKILASVFIGDFNPTESAAYARRDNSPQVVLLGYSVRYYGDLIFEAAGFNKQ
jgi:hypothetical protein